MRLRLSIAALAATLAVIPSSPLFAQMKSDMPPLPDMRFAEIPAASRANYQGDRFSYLEAGRPDAPVVLLLQGVGANAKLHLQFRTRHWESLDSNGETYSDNGYQCTWDVTRAQTGKSGILVNYTGGNVALGMNQERWRSERRSSSPRWSRRCR